MRTRSGIMRINARSLFLSSNSTKCIRGRCLSSTPRLIMDNNKHADHLVERYLSNSLLSVGLASQRRCTRFYSSKDDGGENKTETKSENSEGIAAEELPELSARGARFRDEFLTMIVPWEELPDVSLDTFPYYIPEGNKTHLLECMASHLKENKGRKYARRLDSASNRILLRSIPGTGKYRDRLVSALARAFQAPLLKLDSSSFPPYDFISESKPDEGSSESDEEDSCCEHESDDEENYPSDKEIGGDGDDDEDTVRPLKEGDRVKYTGSTTSIKGVNNRNLSKGQRGEVKEVKGEKVAVVFHINGLEAEADEKSKATAAKKLVTWLDVKHVERDPHSQMHDCYIAMEVLCEVLESQQPIVVYFTGSIMALASKTSYIEDDKLVQRAKKMLDQLSGRVVLIYGQDDWEAGEEEMKKFPDSSKQYISSLKARRRSYEEKQMQKLFENISNIRPPKDEELLKTFVKQLEEDRLTMISEGNLSEMRKVLKEHNLICMDLENANINDKILTRAEAKEIIGCATNHYLSSCPLPCVKDGRLQVPHESIKVALLRLKEKETEAKKASNKLQDLASGEFETRFVSAVVCPSDINVKFDDVGALEHVKRDLFELCILPLRRPELFSHGNLLRPCKGMLLFGPPGTGKTLIAKALATEAGANFISVTPASLGSMWYGESENLTRALFSYATKLAPVIIFVDEVDALLGARGSRDHEATRKVKNEFMAAWDGLSSKESQRILVLGATNRPFDLDDAVIRRMPRRIYVGLPDVVNRSKILKVILAKENLEAGFCFEQLAEATEGYSGSDIKNLCVAAAYIPVQEILEKESKGEKSDGVPVIRALSVDDFIRSTAKVKPSVAYNSSSIKELREWNEQYGEGESRT